MTAIYKIHKVVDGRNNLTEFMFKSFPSGEAIGVSEVKGADSVVSQALKHLTENHLSTSHGDMLKHEKRVKEIELAG